MFGAHGVDLGVDLVVRIAHGGEEVVVAAERGVEMGMRMGQVAAVNSRRNTKSFRPRIF